MNMEYINNFFKNVYFNNLLLFLSISILCALITNFDENFINLMIDMFRAFTYYFILCFCLSLTFSIILFPIFNVLC